MINTLFHALTVIFMFTVCYNLYIQNKLNKMHDRLHDLQLHAERVQNEINKHVQTILLEHLPKQKAKRGRPRKK